MFKWLLTILISLAVLAAATPWLQRLGIGRLPGDVKLNVRGRDYFLPFASTLLFCIVAWAGLARPRSFQFSGCKYHNI